MMMGGYLGKLDHAGLVYRHFGKDNDSTVLTSEGRKMLKENKELLEV